MHDGGEHCFCVSIGEVHYVLLPDPKRGCMKSGISKTPPQKTKNFSQERSLQVSGVALKIYFSKKLRIKRIFQSNQNRFANMIGFLRQIDLKFIYRQFITSKF